MRRLASCGKPTSFVALILILAFPTLCLAESAGAGSEGGGSASSEGFNYDDGSGSVTVVDYSRGSQDISKAAREGRTITLKGVRGSRRGHFGTVPEYHRVIRGDTLWDLSSHYYATPWNWPRIWSYNPDITNPNWIYPGDRLRLRAGGPVEEPAPATIGYAWAKGQPPGTVFQRSRGFIDRDELETMGTIVGSREEVIMLAEHDEAYIEFPSDDNVTPGQEYTVFRVRDDVETPEGGRKNLGVLVEILGAVRVVSYDPEENIARGVITESINPIERGHRVGPIQRRYDIIPPVQNQVDLEGYVIMALEPVEIYGEHFVVFVDRGQEDGILEGNRLFVRRRRDMLRESNDDPDDRAGYPYEIIAEMRVVEVRPRTSTCIVTRSVTDIHDGDSFEMRRGY